MPDLWPAEFGVLEVVPPVAILREQAQLLASKTNGLVHGNVNGFGSGNIIQFNFDLFAPALNYTFRLFTIEHGVDPYPVKIMAGELFSQPLVAADPEQFAEMLKNVLASDKVLKVIRSLITQSKK
jgi:hypothetical protein